MGLRKRRRQRRLGRQRRKIRRIEKLRNRTGRRRGSLSWRTSGRRNGGGGCERGVGGNRDQHPSDAQRRHVRFYAMNIDAEHTSRRLEVDDPRIEDFDNGVGTFPVIGEFAVFPQKVLKIEEDQLTDLEGVGGRRAIMVVLRGTGGVQALLRGQLTTQLKPLEPLGREGLAIMRRRGVRKVRHAGLHAERQEVWRGFSGAVHRRVVGQHERRKIKFPIQSVGINKAGEVFGNEFIHDLSLGVTLRVIRGGGGMLNFEESIQFVSELSTKFLTTVGDDFKRKTITTDPTIEDSIADRSSLLVGEGEDFGVFMKGIRDA